MGSYPGAYTAAVTNCSDSLANPLSHLAKGSDGTKLSTWESSVRVFFLEVGDCLYWFTPGLLLGHLTEALPGRTVGHAQ